MKFIKNILVISIVIIFFNTSAKAAVLKQTIQGTVSAFSKTSVTLIGEDGEKFDIPRSFLSKEQPVIGSRFRMELSEKDNQELTQFNKNKKK